MKSFLKKKDLYFKYPINIECNTNIMFNNILTISIESYCNKLIDERRLSWAMA